LVHYQPQRTHGNGFGRGYAPRARPDGPGNRQHTNTFAQDHLQGELAKLAQQHAEATAKLDQYKRDIAAQERKLNSLANELHVSGSGIKSHPSADALYASTHQVFADVREALLKWASGFVDQRLDQIEHFEMCFGPIKMFVDSLKNGKSPGSGVHEMLQNFRIQSCCQARAASLVMTLCIAFGQEKQVEFLKRYVNLLPNSKHDNINNDLYGVLRAHSTSVPLPHLGPAPPAAPPPVAAAAMHPIISVVPRRYISDDPRANGLGGGGGGGGNDPIRINSFIGEVGGGVYHGHNPYMASDTSRHTISGGGGGGGDYSPRPLDNN